MAYIKEGYNAGPGATYATPAEAKRARDARARDLRKQGYTVTCKKWDFINLARAVAFTLEAWHA